MRRGGYREESIYSLVPPEEVVAKKPPMYKSPFAPPVMEKKAFGMMGREVPKPNPSEFMKAGSKTTNIKLPAPKAFIRDEEKKPGVPTREEKPIYGLKTSKNYITANAVENILQAPRRLAGSEAKFTDKEDYGRVPEYLQRIKQERKEEDDFITHIQQVRREQTGMKILPEEERLKILGGLKDRWTELNKQYISGTSVVIGTERARLRKENLEAQLTQVPSPPLPRRRPAHREPSLRLMMTAPRACFHCGRPAAAALAALVPAPLPLPPLRAACFLERLGRGAGGGGAPWQRAGGREADRALLCSARWRRTSRR